MDEIAKIHEAMLKFLLEWKEEEEANGRDFFFTLRRINNSDRLSQGYWFYGNEGYLAVSFWTGMNWKNKTPNIIFVHIPETEANYLEISPYDTRDKKAFVEKFLYPSPLGIKPDKKTKRYYKHYEFGSFEKALWTFLVNDKPIIDKVISSHQDFFGSDHPNDKIGFIDSEDFERWFSKISGYRETLNYGDSIDYMPNALLSFDIQEFTPIKNLVVDNIPANTQWIFITGENGSGKTSILRALTIGLCKNHEGGQKIAPDEYSHFLINLGVQIDGKKETYRVSNETSLSDKWIPEGFASYGPIRLLTDQYQKNSPKEIVDLQKMSTHGLFYHDGLLRDLRVHFTLDKIKSPNLKYSYRFTSIEENLINIIPNIGKISLSKEFGVSGLLFHEYDESGFLQDRGVQFEKLASGTKNLIALIGDLIMRFFEMQPSIDDPSEFKGIVVIDEIDIHLHPKLQKEIVVKLSKAFPKIQFIVTTHSPIPLLGAPKNSTFLRVYREEKGIIQIEKLEIDIGNLLPNTLLSSPIFGFHELIPTSHSPEDRIRTEDHFEEVIKNDLIKSHLRKVAKRLKQGIDEKDN